jgi:hypothetical protein
MLDKGASAWLILPEREVLLAQSGTSKIYSNGISKLDLTNDDVTLDVNDTTKYVACKGNGVAKVAKVEVNNSAQAVKPELVAIAKNETKPSSEKGWLDKLKFWERDEQVASPKADIKSTTVDSPKVVEPAAVVDVPVKATVTAPSDVNDVVVPIVAEAKATESAPADLQAMIKEAAQQGAQEQQAVAPAEEQISSYQSEVAKTLDAWAGAWKNKNADAYLSFYSDKFKPDGMSKKAWTAQRKQRVGANPAEIALVLDKVSVVADTKKAEVTFIQHYTSGKFSDTVAKVLSFENEDGHWLIVKETAQSKK